MSAWRGACVNGHDQGHAEVRSGSKPEVGHGIFDVGFTSKSGHRPPLSAYGLRPKSQISGSVWRKVSSTSRCANPPPTPCCKWVPPREFRAKCTLLTCIAAHRCQHNVKVATASRNLPKPLTVEENLALPGISLSSISRPGLARLDNRCQSDCFQSHAAPRTPEESP